MKETIVTIPINDLFAPKCGCPLCRMEEMLEEQYVTFITGDAMMEPSVRVATNKKGFCHRHFSRMTQIGNKLPNALILETHLYHLVSTVFVEWAKGGEFRKTYQEQPFICLKHYQFLMATAMSRGCVPSKLLGEFHADTAALTKNYLDALYGDIKHFVSMFDYRNRGKDWGTSVDAIERSIEFLTGEKPDAPTEIKAE